MAYQTIETDEVETFCHQCYKKLMKLAASRCRSQYSRIQMYVSFRGESFSINACLAFLPNNETQNNASTSSNRGKLHLAALKKFSNESLWAGYHGEQSTNPKGFWTIEYYQRYFDVDTKLVRHIDSL